jgi:hypothetical protein
MNPYQDRFTVAPDVKFVPLTVIGVPTGPAVGSSVTVGVFAGSARAGVIAIALSDNIKIVVSRIAT